MKIRALLLVLCLSAAVYPQSRPNLVPDAPGTTPSYWCTWGSQNYASPQTARNELNHSIIAAALTQQHVFGQAGWGDAFPKVRSDMYLLFDLGWDVPADTEFDHARWKLGSQIVADDKFPCCSGSPVERLRKLDALAREAGWRGAGIWIAAQALGDGRDGKMLSQAEMEQFYRERLQWSRDAGIGYWKIDYGSRNNADFRRTVVRLAAEIAPMLTIENARGSCPLNDEDCPWEEHLAAHHAGRFAAWGDGSVLADSTNIAAFSQVFRTYDITARFSTETTLDRVAQILSALSGNAGAKGILNAEDEPYIAAALGTSMGIMRNPHWIDPQEAGSDYDPRNFRHRSDEVTRAVRWQRIAPAFAIGGTPVQLDSRRLDDTWVFQKGQTWAGWVVGKKVVQGAPARVARGMNLPEVAGQDVPYVISARNPNGAISVATLPRLDAARGYYFPRVSVTLRVPAIGVPVGVFGHYGSLTLELPSASGKLRVWAQDLAADSAEDVTARIVRRGNRITIPGALIDQIGTSAASPGDVSDPGLVLRID